MNVFGMTWEEIFALLLSAMGPVGITMSYMPIARALPPAMQRQLAWRTVLVGFIVAVGLMLLGGGVDGSRCDLFRPGDSHAVGWAKRSRSADAHQRAAAARHFTPGGASADLPVGSGGAL